MSVSTLNALHKLVDERRLLDHAFYRAWSNGELTREALQTYAIQYYQWVRAFPTWLSSVHANTTDLSMRQAILENLIDEERGPENHPELWLRFADALGLQRDAVGGAEPLPETTGAIAMMRQVCRESPAVAGVGALYVYEVQQPDVMRTKREGLATLYGVTTGHDYFVVHEERDVEHSADERALLMRHLEGHEADALAAATIALEATYLILDGVERVRH